MCRYNEDPWPRQRPVVDSAVSEMTLKEAEETPKEATPAVEKEETVEEVKIVPKEEETKKMDTATMEEAPKGSTAAEEPVAPMEEPIAPSSPKVSAPPTSPIAPSSPKAPSYTHFSPEPLHRDSDVAQTRESAFSQTEIAFGRRRAEEGSGRSPRSISFSLSRRSPSPLSRRTWPHAI